ncbi:Hypothetical protein POVR1_LOCUS560 [uncultured virus]|nr:Hypothetical protein POVR1_LOCUS560 [uncultured virus]
MFSEWMVRESRLKCFGIIDLTHHRKLIDRYHQLIPSTISNAFLADMTAGVIDRRYPRTSCRTTAEQLLERHPKALEVIRLKIVVLIGEEMFLSLNITPGCFL